MADRSRRVARARQISEVTDDSSDHSASESEQDWDPRRADSARRAGKIEPPALASIGRTKRGGDDKHQSIRLTMKVAPSKLREVTRANEVDSLHDTLGGGKVIDGPRSRRAAASNPRLSARAAARPRYVEYGESELEEDEDEEEEDQEEDEDQDVEDDDEGPEDEEDGEEEDEEEEEEAADDLEELGAEAESGSEDEDIEMEDAPPVSMSRKLQTQPKPPKITLKPPPKSEAKLGAKTKITVTPAQVGPLKSVEDQEMEEDLEDEEEEEDAEEESSELSEDEDATNLNEEDAEGDEEPLEEEDAEGLEREVGEDEEMEDDSGDETPASGMATPDPNRLTKRQRGRPEDQTQLMALDMAPQQRKFFTDEEKAMKKDEHARKRKELTKRKILEEKTAALNRLLKPQASKARGAAPKPETLAAAAAAAAAEEEEPVEKANPLYTRWISSQDGIRLGVPEEWLDKKIGRVLGPPLSPSNGAMIQELS